MRWHDWTIAVTLTALAVTTALQFRSDVAATLSQTGADRSYQDTTYVIAHINYVAMALLIAVLATALHYALIRSTSPRLAASGAIAICTLALGIILATAPQILLGPPQSYLDYADTFRRWQILSALGGTMALSALLTLAVLTIRALLIRRRAKSSA